MYSPLIHPIHPGAMHVRARPGASVDPVRYPVPIRARPPALIHPVMHTAGVRQRTLSAGGELDLVEKARAAADWIRGRIRKFFDLERRLSLAHHQAAQVEGAARQAGQLDAAADAQRVRETAFELLMDYDRVKTQLEDLVARVPGLGVIPVAMLIAAGAAIIAVSLAMAAIFRRETALEKSLDLVASGVLTPTEADKMSRDRAGGLFAGMGLTAGVGGLVAIAVALAVGVPLLADTLVPPRSRG